MSLRNILDAHQSIAAATAKIGKVYKHRVLNVEEAQMASLFKDSNGRIDVCFITRESSQADDRGPNNNYRQPSIVMAWYRSVSRTADDVTNSEDSFQDDVESVMDTFDANRKLTVGGVHKATWSAAMQARNVTYVMFQGALCHYAELVHVVEDGPRSTTSS